MSFWGTVAFAVTAVLALAPRGIDLFGAVVPGIVTVTGVVLIRHEINFSDFFPFGLSKRVENDVDEQLVEISPDRFVDDYLLDQDEFIKEVDHRIANMEHHYLVGFGEFS